MEDQLALGVVLFGLLVVPFFAYGVLSYLARKDIGSTESREDRTPSSTTQAAPSRTIPGSSKER